MEAKVSPNENNENDEEDEGEESNNGALLHALIFT